jgi:hypothetical protein
VHLHFEGWHVEVCGWVEGREGGLQCIRRLLVESKGLRVSVDSSVQLGSVRPLKAMTE